MRSCFAAKRALASVPRHTKTASRHKAVSHVESIRLKGQASPRAQAAKLKISGLGGDGPASGRAGYGEDCALTASPADLREARHPAGKQGHTCHPFIGARPVVLPWLAGAGRKATYPGRGGRPHNPSDDAGGFTRGKVTAPGRRHPRASAASQTALAQTKLGRAMPFASATSLKDKFYL